MAQPTNHGRVVPLVMAIQQEFLDQDDLVLTLRDAQTRFGTDRTMCEAVLSALVDSNVLTRRADGTYRRYRPTRPAAA